MIEKEELNKYNDPSGISYFIDILIWIIYDYGMKWVGLLYQHPESQKTYINLLKEIVDKLNEVKQAHSQQP